LTATPGGKRVAHATGLYHFAILVPSRPDLARSIQRIAESGTPIQGAADHFVSEALYLADPEGNGIEIYRDRPRSEWYEADGRFRLGTAELDVQGVMGSLQGQSTEWKGLPAGTIMGHIHLHVGSIPATEAFYRDVMSMDIMMNIGSATFMSYDGYHHHVGGNTWAGRTPPPPDALGLDHYILRVPTRDNLDTILANLANAETAVEQRDDFYVVRDPSQNQIALTA
jgi:catechol 2,3-dioxygenase